ncbi:MAG: tyrosine-type recombinase/integrase [Pseudonocardia sp.]
MLRAVAKGKPGRPAPGAKTVRVAHGVLRSALTSARRARLVAFNAAADIELPAASRPKVRPWQPAELGAFLDSLGAERLAPLFELIAATRLRRGEACGLRWADVDLTRGVLVVRQQLTQVDLPAERQRPCPSCGKVHKGHAFGPPKTASGDARIVELDGGTAGVLLAHRLTQDTERTQWGAAYVDHDLVFAREDGNPLPLADVTKRFAELAVEAGLRPIRLLSRPGARFRCFHRSVSPGRSPNPSCRSLGNGLSTVSAVRRGSWLAMGLGSCVPGRCNGRPSLLRSGRT